MGVRGLTTFIAKYSSKYLENYELNDTYLVIDGYNIASQLYKWHCTKNDCFGGDYDKYAKSVYDFFNLLQTCNIIPLVVFDGAYEDKKLKTVYSRMLSKIQIAKNLNSVTQSSLQMFPLLLRDLFTDIVLKLGIKAVRCDFEADYEMACLARILNCPLVSYDSDFYVFDVLYIPFSTFQMNTHKIKNVSPEKYGIYCKIYKIDKFIAMYGGLHKENLPLLSILLGNDYISKSSFRKFFEHIKLAKKKRLQSEQQRKIAAVIKWLQHESYESAVRKILLRLDAQDRKNVAEQIKNITDGYICNNTKLLGYLNLKVPEHSAVNQLANIEGIPDETNDEDDISTETFSNNSSDESDNEVDLKLNNAQVSENIPEWFLNNFRKCAYPPAFLDVLARNTYFFIPQLEDYFNTSSHNISLNIISALHKILTSSSLSNLVYVSRTGNAGIGRYTAPLCKIDLPTLQSLQSISKSNAKNLLFEILELPNNLHEVLTYFPSAWQLYFLSTIYWVRKAAPKVTNAYVYSVVLCVFVLSKIDTVVGFYRATTKFRTKFDDKIKRILKISQQAEACPKHYNTLTNLIQSLDKIDEADCILCLNELIVYFQMEQKMKTHAKSFDVCIIDAFAQFQSCIMHIKYLNTLLNKAYDDVLVSDFYDGTFLYNMCNNLMKRNDLPAYLSLLLKNSPKILQCFNIIIESLSEFINCDLNPSNTSRRRRRRRNKKVNKNSEGGENCRLSEEEYDCNESIDVNNRFSILSLV